MSKSDKERNIKDLHIEKGSKERKNKICFYHNIGKSDIYTKFGTVNTYCSLFIPLQLT